MFRTLLVTVLILFAAAGPAARTLRAAHGIFAVRTVRAAAAPPVEQPEALTTVREGFRSNLTGPALALSVGVDALLNLATELRQHHGIGQSFSSTAGYLFSVPYLGCLVGGAAGAALGALCPVPVLGGLVGGVLAGLPTMFGAMLGSTVVSQLATHRSGDPFHISKVLKDVDWVTLTLQAVGSVTGSVIAAALAPGLLGQVFCGLAGCYVGLEIARLLKGSIGSSAPTSNYANVQVKLRPSVHASVIAPDRAAARARLYQQFLEAANAGRSADAARLYADYTRLGSN